MARNTTAALDMNPTPMAMAVHPALAAPCGSRRPTAWPTRTAAAEATPNGTMNVTDARFNAI